MSDKTEIEWTDATWNPLRGCSRVSEGCRHCYAEGVAKRFSGPGMPYEGLIAKGGQWNGQIKLVPAMLDQPSRWRRPRRIFVNSMSDLFHENVPFEFVAAVFGIMAAASWHTFQVLTKRPTRALEFFRWIEENPERKVYDTERLRKQCPGDDWRVFFLMQKAAEHLPLAGKGLRVEALGKWPLPNVWLGVSVEDQATANERIPLLLQAPAAVRWISAEPLLESIDLSKCKGLPIYWEGTEADGPLPIHCGLSGIKLAERKRRGWASYTGRGLDWVVVGGESGSDARPMHPEWARLLRDQCAAAGVPFLFKQWGEWRPICEGGPDWYDYLYRPRRVAKDGEDQTALNDCWGRYCTVKEAIVHNDGNVFGILDQGTFQGGKGAMHMFAVGKKAAGRLLDGVQHDGYPEVLS